MTPIASGCIRVAAVRRRFPKPSNAFYPEDDNSYCVGGALCRFVEPTAIAFPRIPLLGLYLQMANMRLMFSSAEIFATVITRRNDAGDFEGAWRALGDALEARS